MGKRLSKELTGGNGLRVFEEEGQHGWSRMSEEEEEEVMSTHEELKGACLALWGHWKDWLLSRVS